MARTKFNAVRTPEYLVITACFPEDVSGIAQKLADLHLLYADMLRYSTRYIRLIEEEHRRCGSVLDLHAPVTENTRALENHVRVMFSAFLAAHSSLMDYLEAEVKKRGPDAVKWLEHTRDKSKALNSFNRLRNLELHDESLHTLIGMRYRILGPPLEVRIAIEAGETHIHWPLRHEGVGFTPWGLPDTAKFRAQQGLVEYLTYSSILELAHLDVHELVTLLETCEAKEYFVPDRPLACGICANLTRTSELEEGGDPSGMQSP